MPRVSSKLLANLLRQATLTLGMRVAKSYKDVGGVQLGQAYGGVQMEIITSEGGGVSTMGPRMRPTDMADALELVIDMGRVAQDTRFHARARALENPKRKRRRSFKVNPSDRKAAERALYSKFGSYWDKLTPRKKAVLVNDVISFAVEEHVTDPDEAVKLLAQRLGGAKNLESYSRTLLAGEMRRSMS